MNPSHWRRARRVTQIISTALFFLLAALTYRDFVTPTLMSGLVPLDLFFRLDPLAAFSAMLAARTIITALVVALAALAAGVVFGRVWCGWLCPLGALLDWISPDKKTLRVHESRRVWKVTKYFLLASALAAALFGNLTFLVLDPLTLLNRTLASAFVPALNVIIVASETALYPLAPLQPFLDWIEQGFRGTVLPAEQTHYTLGALFALVFAGVVALDWIAPRCYCRYLCPLGALYALLAKIAWLRPRLVSDCDRCAACVRVCPTAAITLDPRGFALDFAECVVCLDCVAACPKSSIAFGFGGTRAARAAVDLSRRHFVTGAAFGIASIALFRSESAAFAEHPYLIRPPGARDNAFLAKCIRCSECVKICPTGALQPSLLEAGLEGLWTPLLVARLGYCDFSCNACGQICPTGAIPPLALEEKRKRVIGTAYIDQNRCLPWASFRPCIVCQEVCPLPENAIVTEDVDVIAPDGRAVHLQRPRVLPELCIGCGLCEYKCPVSGSAAIRVYVPAKLPPTT